LTPLKSQFSIFLAGKHGIAFMLGTIPFHQLYHFSNGSSLITSTARHYYMAATMQNRVAWAACHNWACDPGQSRSLGPRRATLCGQR